MAATVIVVGSVGSQPALGAGLTAVPGFVEPLDSHRIRLKELLNDVSVSVVEIAAEVSPCKSSEISHTVDEKLRVRDAVFLFEFFEKLFGGISASMPRESCVEHDFRFYVNGSVEPRFLLIFELDLFFINRNTVWFCCEVLVVMVGVSLVPVLDGRDRR
jgi:hypothetical protein